MMDMYGIRLMINRSSKSLVDLWFLLFGAWIATSCLLAGIIYCVTIVFIPFGVGCFKLAGAAIFPLGKRIVSVEEANRVRETIRTQIASAK